VFLVLSGEGASDIGVIAPDDAAAGYSFRCGPLALVVDQIVGDILGFSPIECGRIRYISRVQLARRAKSSMVRPRLVLPGNKRGAGLAGHYRQAYAFAAYATEVEREENDCAVAILFRDSDGTQSDSPRRWKQLWNAIESAFTACGYKRGVPMIPKPKQESWFVCALKKDCYQNCAALEDESGNDNSTSSLKQMLEDCLGTNLTVEILNDIVNEKKFDYTRMDMPSFNEFLRVLRGALTNASGVGPKF